MKKKVCLLLAVINIFCAASCKAETAEEIFDKYTPPSESFVDMTGYEWAEEAVAVLSRAGIVSGIGDNMFMPERNITRLEYIKLVCLSCGMVNNNAESSYSDIPVDSWGYVYASSAKDAGMLDIYSSDLLDANVDISREDMAYIAFKALKFIGTNDDFDKTYKFYDDGEISDYSKDAVYLLKQKNIINGRENDEFAPKDKASRAEAAKIVYGIYKTAAESYLQ